MKLPKGVRLERVAVVFSQESDCCESEAIGQELTIGTEDGGGGSYLILKTDRWAIDDAAEFMALCAEVLAMVPEAEL